MIQDGQDIPQDILTYMLSSKKVCYLHEHTLKNILSYSSANKENWNIEELVDYYLTFYVAGGIFVSWKNHYFHIIVCAIPQCYCILQLAVEVVFIHCSYRILSKSPTINNL